MLDKKKLLPIFLCIILFGSIIFISFPVTGVNASQPDKIPVIIGFKDKPDKALIHEYGGDIKYEYSIIPAIACSLTQDAIDALSKNPKIAYIEKVGKIHVTQQTLPWGVERIGANIVHTYNEGAGINASIIDTGIDLTHPDLPQPVLGVDYIQNDSEPDDENGHGTHVAGIIAALDNDIGVVGVAPETNLLIAKAFDASGSGSLDDIIAAIDWSVQNGAQIISMSFGTDIDYTSLHDACDAAYARGVVLVAAAGNDAKIVGRVEFDTVDYPARYDSVIAVGATDENDIRASWSSTGSTLELAAPGVNIYSTLPTYTVTLSADYGYSYGTLSGTSMACPHVSGTVALILASPEDAVIDYNGDGVNETNGDGIWTPEEVRAVLHVTADDLGDSGWDTWYGYGLVDADEAAPSTVDTTPPKASDETPADGSYVNNARPTISVDITDNSGVDSSSITMTINSISVTPLLTSITNGYHVEYTPESDLAEGTVVVNVTAEDIAETPNTMSYSWSFTIDLTPPNISNVIVSDITSSSATITWTTDELSDSIVNYTADNVTWSTESDPTLTTSHSITLTGLTPETTYYFKVQSTDEAGNTAVDDNNGLYYSFTTSAPTNTMHVASIDMSTASRTAGPNTFVKAIANVTIVDANGVPVEGATVYGHWEGATTDSDSGITDANGQVLLESDQVKNPSSGTTFTFVVDDVVKEGWTYDSSANAETSDSITV